MSVLLGITAALAAACVPQDKLDASKAEAANGCCKDFTRPCRVPPYPPEEEIEAAGGRDFHYDDYGPRGLYWPYGGSGTFVSAGLVIDAIGGTKGWGHCASVFGIMRTDVQVNTAIADLRPHVTAGDMKWIDLHAYINGTDCEKDIPDVFESTSGKGVRLSHGWDLSVWIQCAPCLRHRAH